MEEQVTVIHGKNSFDIGVSLEQTVRDIKALLYLRTNIAPAHQKVFHQSKKLRDNTCLKDIFVNDHNAAPRARTLALIGSLADDIKHTQQITKTKGESIPTAKLKRRRMVICNPRADTSSKYGFRSIEPLPGLPNV